MHLIAREMVDADVEECVRLACCLNGTLSLFKNTRWREKRTEVWWRLLRCGAIRSGLVEDLDGHAGRRILTGGFAAFVKPAWLRTYLDSPFPHVGEWIIEEFARGNDEIILTNDELRMANSEAGLHSIVLARGWCLDEIPSSVLFPLKQLVPESFCKSMDGYNHNEFLTEALGDVEYEFYRANDTWRERSRYKNYYRKERRAIPIKDRPILMGLTRAEAEEPGSEMSVLSKLFVRRELRFFFSPAQQELLLLARVHISDRELSRASGIKMEAMGRRFDRIYKRVELLQGTNHPVFPPGTNRAARRRLIVNYLEANMQELRPHNFRKPPTSSNGADGSR